VCDDSVRQQELVSNIERQAKEKESISKLKLR